MVTSGTEPEGLAEFSRMLSVFTHFGSLQVRLEILHGRQHAGPLQPARIWLCLEPANHVVTPPCASAMHCQWKITYMLSQRLVGCQITPWCCKSVKAVRHRVATEGVQHAD